MARMIGRPIPRAVLLTVLVSGVSATMPVAPAYAWECPGVTPEQIKICQREARETPTLTPSTSTGGGSASGGLGDWVSEHAGLVVLVVAALIAWAVIAGLRSGKAQETAAKAERLAAEGAHARANMVRAAEEQEQRQREAEARAAEQARQRAAEQVRLRAEADQRAAAEVAAAERDNAVREEMDRLRKSGGGL
ncbi:hypothetical protein [Tsukamurella pseudospumae]|nr:hypothetical protein [Tsukamurella pseudospumae]